MAHCTDRTEDVFTCMNHYSCHTCPYWSINVKKNKCEEEEKVNEIHNKITHKINKAETCKNYSYWCGKLDFISNCETCEFYKTE